MIRMPTEDEPAVIHCGDCLEVLREMPDGVAQTCVTSPPYWGGLRDYGHPSQLGMERDPSGYAAALLEVGRQVRRVLKADGTLWLNIGDSYAASGKGGGGSAGGRKCWESVRDRKGFRMPPAGYKMKDLSLSPFLVAEAFRRDGWYLRSVVVWEKPAAVEPLRLDRPAVSHEYLFLLSVSEVYYAENPGEAWWGHSVWKIDKAADASHPAGMPEELARRCIVCSSRPGDVILDPFAGGGTTPAVAAKRGRRAIGVELNPAYSSSARRRIDEALGVGGLFAPPKPATADLFDLATAEE